MKNFYVVCCYVNDFGQVSYNITPCGSKINAIRMADLINSAEMQYSKENGFVSCEVVSSVYKPLEVKVDV